MGFTDMANRLDSMLTEKQRLAMMADMMGNPDAENMNVLARTASIPAMPENYIQNSGTGAVTSLDEFAPNALMRQMQPALDYKSGPVEMGGMKGYRLAGDPFTVQMADGSRLSLGNDVEATRKRQMQDLEMQKAKTGIAHQQEQINASVFTRNQKEGIPGAGVPQITLEKQYGKAPDGKRWTLNGTLEDVPGGVKQSDANAVIDLANEAFDVLPKAHGSGVGTVLGGAANIFGIPSDQNKADAQLKVLAGGLVSKMPKMSGPQSDRDVLLYREMAGQVGDSTIPISTRVAALEMVRKLNEKYSSGISSPFGAAPQKPEPTVQSSTPPTNSNGWVLHVDAKGNKAYVGPNGQIQEVK